MFGDGAYLSVADLALVELATSVLLLPSADVHAVLVLCVVNIVNSL